MLKIILCCSLLSSFSSAMALDLDTSVKSIYGADDRQEASGYANPEIRIMAQSVAAQISNDLISTYDIDHVELKNKTLSEDLKVCKDERFSEQNTVSHCTAFLVAPNLVLTASHCVIKKNSCESYKWIFSYTNESNVISKNDVYSCAEVQKLNVGLDYALVRLDRSVQGRAPFKLFWKRKASYIVIGHPSGLPLKTADNVKEVPVFDKELFKSPQYFGLNADTFGGNSGSPVIDNETHEVAGILVSGVLDYKFDSAAGCFRPVKYNSDGSQGAEVAVKTNSIKIK